MTSIQLVFYNNPDDYPPIINSIRLLAGAGFRVDLLCREFGERRGISYPGEVRIRRIQIATSNPWREYVGFVSRVLIEADKTATIFVGYDMHGFLPARLLAFWQRRPLVFHCHDFVERGRTLRMGGRLVRGFEQRFARTSDLVIVPDRERASVMVQELQLPRAPLIVANAPIHRNDSSGSVLRRALAARGKKFDRILLRQGRIGPGHAIESTLLSMPYWPSSNWGFVLLGAGDPAYLASLAGLAEEVGVAKQFVVLPPVSYDQVAEYTRGAHAGHALYEPTHVNNLYITTASNKIMEYLAAGLPILVSDRPGLCSLVEAHHCGVTADESSPQSIAAAVTDLLGDDCRAERMGTAAAEAFERVFNYERQFAPVLERLRVLSVTN